MTEPLDFSQIIIMKVINNINPPLIIIPPLNEARIAQL